MINTKCNFSNLFEFLTRKEENLKKIAKVFHVGSRSAPLSSDDTRRKIFSILQMSVINLTTP